MPDRNTGYPHTAITPWGGFLYQGKVAIYHVVHLMENSGACTGYTLQLDSLEDFTILDGAGSIISLHQVKAKKSQYYSTYKEAFEKLTRNANDQGCNNAQFHLAQEITDKTVQEISTSHSPVAIYKYGQDHWCPVDQIDLKIEEKLKVLLANLFSDYNSNQSDEYVRKARSYLDQIVLKQVLKIHGIVHAKLQSDRQAAYTQTIPFSEFQTILHDDLTQKDRGEDYYFYVLLHDFHKYYQEYCIEEEPTEDESKKLSHCMMQIGRLTKTEMKQFIRNIMPHRQFKFNDLSDYKDGSFNKDEIQEAFLSILQQLRQPEFRSEAFFHWHAEGKSFAPTTIHKGRPLARKVCKDIVRNALDTDLDVMFEGCNLITVDIDVESITDEVFKLIRTPEYDSREDNRISMWKAVSLISLNNAKEIIND